MIKEIQGKVLLSHVKNAPDPWFGLTYTINLYRGCQHQCIYCDSRSACYRIENFKDILVKVNAIDLLQRELATKRIKGTIGTGAMNDPYMPVEKQYNLTRRALIQIAHYRFPVHVITKSTLVLRDIDVLKSISQVYATVSFSITTANDRLAKQIEPGASKASERFDAMAQLAQHGIATGVTMMPLLPFIEDYEDNVRTILTRARDSGASYVIPNFGVTLRDRQRVYYYDKLDKLFPGLRKSYERRYGTRYYCAVPKAGKLAELFKEICAEYGIATRLTPYEPETAEQLSLF